MYKKLFCCILSKMKVMKNKGSAVLQAFCVTWKRRFLSVLALVTCFGVPLVAVVCDGLLKVGVARYFLQFYNGNSPDQSVLLFGARSPKRTLKILAEYWLNTYIWLMIPIAGVVLCIQKRYEYRFLPYLVTDNDKHDAKALLEESRKLTDGFKLKMLLLDIALALVVVIPILPLCILLLIPKLKITLAVIGVLYFIGVLAVLPVVREYVFAALFKEISDGKIKPVAKSVCCPFCNSRMDSDCAYCSACGEKLNADSQQASES
ncbi:MAG: DUF975 family protein [Clostridiales bacterium]|nr:DUF975 family protein [Clostridiales bacterium]